LFLFFSKSAVLGSPANAPDAEKDKPMAAIMDKSNEFGVFISVSSIMRNRDNTVTSVTPVGALHDVHSAPTGENLLRWWPRFFIAHKTIFLKWFYG
jgi:hypothetical protein